MDRAVPPTSGGRPEVGVADLFVEKLRDIAQARGRAATAAAIADLARSVHETDSVFPFLARLLETDRHGQRLALELATRLSLPLPEPACRLLVPVLSNTRFPAALRLGVAVQILQTVSTDWVLLPALLDGLLFSLGHDKAVERLQYLLTRVPDHPALLERLEAKRHTAEIPCPRCGVKLGRPDLVVHLWEEHRLLMDGPRARDPWKVIEGWIAEYTRTGRQDLLDRGCELGQQMDEEAGLTRVYRLLLAAGMSDEEARETLTSKARDERSTLCPHCFAAVPAPHDPLPPPFELSRGRISGGGSTVEISDDYLLTHLYVASGNKVLHDGPEPGHGLTARGQTVILMGPLALLAFFLSVALPTEVMPPLTPVSLLLIATVLLYVRIRRRGPATTDVARRAVDHAWKYLAPGLHQVDFSTSDADFAARLAVTSVGLGSPEARGSELRRLVKLTSERVRKGFADGRHLAALRCLQFDDAIRIGEDPLPGLVPEFADALVGDLPFNYADLLLGGTFFADWDASQQARLRVLVRAAAFENDMMASELLEIGRLSGALGELLGADKPDSLKRLQWLWECRGEQPWRRFGSASTVFDLARHASLAARYLADHPELLFFQPTGGAQEGENEAAPILVCESGVYYRTVAIASGDAVFAVLGTTGPFELVVSGQSLRFDNDPAKLVQRLQGWTRFLFRQLLPGASELDGPPNTEKLLPILDQKTLRCPECGNEFVSVSGGIGTLMPRDTEV